MEEAVRDLTHVKLTHPVGSTWQYNNVNYIIAGLIVEVVSGQSYADYVTQHIFEPLDMHHSFASREFALVDELSEGHIYMFGRIFRDEKVRSPAALSTGSLMTSFGDLPLVVLSARHVQTIPSFTDAENQKNSGKMRRSHNLSLPHFRLWANKSRRNRVVTTSNSINLTLSVTTFNKSWMSFDKQDTTS